MKLRKNALSLSENYIFSWCAEEGRQYAAAHPEAQLLSLAVGDVPGPLCRPVLDALQRALDEQAAASGFRGYGPAEGYPFLRRAIAEDYQRRGIAVQQQEVFITHGAKDALADLLRVLPDGLAAAIPMPCYPVYRDLCALLGAKVLPLAMQPDGGFPPPPDAPFDLCFLCSPCNPTGALLSRRRAEQWVQAARRQGALILFDAAYEAYVRQPGALRSIYETKGARDCAVEVGSLSKTAGFTGLRCGHLVIPQQLKTEGGPLAAVWDRLLQSFSNGVPYPVQRGAEAAYSAAGREACRTQIDQFLQNTALLASALPAGSVLQSGSSPYLWFRCGGDSRAFFRRLLERCQILCTPGIGFGDEGEGFCRFSGFCSEQQAQRAAVRLRQFDF